MLLWRQRRTSSESPAWTLEVVGFDFHSIEDAGAAWFCGQRGGGHVDAERGVWLSASANLGWVIDHYVVVYNAIVP